MNTTRTCSNDISHTVCGTKKKNQNVFIYMVVLFNLHNQKIAKVERKQKQNP